MTSGIQQALQYCSHASGVPLLRILQKITVVFLNVVMALHRNVVVNFVVLALQSLPSCQPLTALTYTQAAVMSKYLITSHSHSSIS